MDMVDSDSEVFGWEFTYAACPSKTLLKVQSPSDDWRYGQLGTCNGIVWCDDGASRTKDSPYILSYKRVFKGHPNRGDIIEAPWEGPYVFPDEHLDVAEKLSGIGSFIWTFRFKRFISRVKRLSTMMKGD